MMQITAEQSKNKIENISNGKIFTVTFIKRTDGGIRVMNCRKGVKNHLTGGDRKYNPKDKGLVCVFDMQKNAYRSIALESIVGIKMEGKTFNVAG